MTAAVKGARPSARGGTRSVLVFLNGALRLHAARRAYVPNVHETICDPSAFLRFHGLITAGTSNDRRFAHLALHALLWPK